MNVAVKQLGLWDAPTAMSAQQSHHVPTFYGLEDRYQHLQSALSVAVPLEILHIQRTWGKPTLAMMDDGKRIGRQWTEPGAVGTHIEALMFPDARSKKRREAQAVFADLVWILAIMAFLPYGVRYGDGGRWIAEAKPNTRHTFVFHCSVCGMELAEEPDDLPNDPCTCLEFDCLCERYYCPPHFQEHQTANALGVAA